MDIESAQRRYRDDPVFHQLVQAMMDGMERLQFSPGELREAAVFAEIYFYQRHPYPSQLVSPPWPWPPTEAAARAASAPSPGAQGGPEGAGKHMRNCICHHCRTDPEYRAAHAPPAPSSGEAKEA